jgi:hypothetical protein
MRKLPAFSDKEAIKILGDLCDQRTIAPSLVLQLTEKWVNFSGAGRAHGISEEIELVLAEYLREQEEELDTDEVR